MLNHLDLTRIAAVGLALAVSAAVASGQELPNTGNGAVSVANKDTIAVIENRIHTLEEKVRQLEQDRKKEAQSPAPILVVGREGFALKSADGAFQLKLRGYFQTDGRFFFDDNAPPATSTILLRRMRPLFEATVYKFMDFRLMPDFGEGRTTLFDAHFDLRLAPALAIRAGKYKSPIGMERLQSAQDLLFVERGMPTNLVPSRDLGLDLRGDLAGGKLSYTVGIFNGSSDLGNGDADNGNNKDGIVRVFAQPFRDGKSIMQGLGLGAAASHGVHRGTVTSPFLPGYRSTAQQTVFAYRSDATSDGTTFADGVQNRIAPQGYWAGGPASVFAEYVSSTQEVRLADLREQLRHTAWQIAGSFVVTGETPSYRGLTPAKPFDPGAGKWGALEIGGRYGRLTMDPDAFPNYADPSKQVSAAHAWGIAVNWYLARGIRLMVDYDVTSFTGGAPSGDRETEKVVLTRIQHAF